MREIVDLAARVAEIERRISGMLRHGTVHEVDSDKQTVRLKLGDGPDGPFLSPAIPYGQVAGAYKFHNPPSVGQQLTLLAPGGDWRQAVATPMTWSNANASPSNKGDEHVMTFGSVRVEIRGAEVVVKVGGSVVTITQSKIELKSDEVVTDGATRLDKGNRKVHFKGGKDDDGDTAVDGADRVYV